jgi:hypothetical protein
MKTIDSTTKDVLQRAFSNLVRGLSPEEAEKVLDRQATFLLADSEESNLEVKMPINEGKVIDSIAARYLHQKAFEYK